MLIACCMHAKNMHACIYLRMYAYLNFFLLASHCVSFGPKSNKNTVPPLDYVNLKVSNVYLAYDLHAYLRP